ncbi:MAG: PDZ domain-containing protein [Acidobacteriota bacterium]|nr:PDZ domain-containing protein [Acidobacteriota bacterium]
MRRTLILPAAVVVLASALAAGYVVSRHDRAPKPTAVDEVRAALAARYYRSLPAGVLRLGSVHAMLSALRDPYTAYLTPLSYRLVEHETAANYSGIGVEVLPTERGLVVVGVEHGPAARAGVRRGDVIVDIGGRSVVGLDAAAALDRVANAPGGRISLAVRRLGAVVHLDVRRGLVSAQAARGRLVRYGGRLWGVIRLTNFRTGVAKLVRHEVRALTRGHAAGLVLDLRGDPGGLLSEAVAVSSVFLDGGPVVSLSGAHFVHEEFHATRGHVTKLPLVVLVDRYTASAAEIVAAALEERGRALVVGERTFGKGVVQAVDPLANGAALVVTVASYYTPDGESISRVGVIPELHAVDDPATPQDEALLAALHALARPAS